MDALINPFQTAFVRGRHILDNYLCAHFLTHHLSSSKQKAALLKLDFERAFDHISWQFLLELLPIRGFGGRWCGWIKTLLQSSSTAILLNGVPGNIIFCKRGLRQGDPLSPLLFILCVDVLFKMLQRASDSSVIPTVGIGNLKVHTLQFADDMLLFFDGSQRSAAAIRIILEGFSASSGLSINYSKSAIIPINLSQDISLALSTHLGCSLQDFPITYLGLPLTPKSLSKSDYLPLIEKIDKRLAGWKERSLSSGGRLVLLNSVLSSIPTYFSSVFRLPIWVERAIDKIRRGFFWRGKKLNSGFHCLVRWDVVCRPKPCGGLGIRNIKCMNSALLLRGLWRFHNEPSLPWVKLIRNKHYKRFPLSPISRIPAGCSPIWKTLLKLVPHFFTSASFVLANGNDTPFWHSRWCADTTLKAGFPNLYVAARFKPASVKVWCSRYANRLVRGFISPLNEECRIELQRFSNLVALTLLSSEADSVVWRWRRDGKFTV